MRLEHIIAVLGCVIASVIGVRYFEFRSDAHRAPSAQANANIAIARPTGEPAPYQQGWGREVRIRAGQHNQFFVTAAVNQRPASFLVDTGASFVALRDSDARSAGIHTSWADYTHDIQTANGLAKAAYVDIDEIEIDGLRVNDVRAFVVEDELLHINLLGMSFLSQLEGVETRGDEMILKGR